MPNNTTQYLKPFADQGHYTGVHDVVFDDIMPMCPPNAWKILCFVIRKTKGWSKESDRLSYSQIRGGTGIASNSTIKSALGWLTSEKHKLLHAERGRYPDGKQGITLYSLNLDFTVERPITETDRRITETVGGPVTETVIGPVTETVETINTQKVQETNNKKHIEVVAPSCREVGVALSLLEKLPGYPQNRAENTKHLEKRYAKHKDSLFFTKEVENFCEYYEDKGFKKGERPRAKLTTWLNNAALWHATNSNGKASPNGGGKERRDYDKYDRNEEAHALTEELERKYIREDAHA